jgi:hypothetical protein
LHLEFCKYIMKVKKWVGLCFYQNYLF